MSDLHLFRVETKFEVTLVTNMQASSPEEACKRVGQRFMQKMWSDPADTYTFVAQSADRHPEFDVCSSCHELVLVDDPSGHADDCAYIADNKPAIG